MAKLYKGLAWIQIECELEGATMINQNQGDGQNQSAWSGYQTIPSKMTKITSILLIV